MSLRSGRGPSLAFTCHAKNSLATAAPRCLVAQAAAEQSVVMTRSFTSMLLLGAAAAALAGAQEAIFVQLGALPPLVGDLLGANAAFARRLGRDAAIQRFVFLGSGVNYGLAAEAALKKREMALVPCQAFHLAEFRHGQKAIVGSDLLVVGLVSEAARARGGRAGRNAGPRRAYSCSLRHPRTCAPTGRSCCPPASATSSARS
jgi:glucosamine--fructose-6-phosphate aminotransferase (isomerizing)